ncbi:hypothetical protein [Kaistia adipata]|nr:hypothetical protein [Kaistia adipata]
MRVLQLAEIEAMAARTVVARDFVQVAMKHRSAGLGRMPAFVSRRL